MISSREIVVLTIDEYEKTNIYRSKTQPPKECNVAILVLEGGSKPRTTYEIRAADQSHLVELILLSPHSGTASFLMRYEMIGHVAGEYRKPDGSAP